jgi:hypothetical protein
MSMLMAQELQAAGIGFISVRARHQKPPLTTHVEEFVASTEGDLELFRALAFKKGWTAPNDDKPNWRVATPDEIKRSEQWS